jgi:glycosyltransferase involved in cell wall biosynthesis
MKKVLDMMPYSYLPYFSGGQKSIAQFLDYLGREVALTVISVEKNDAELARTYTLLPVLKNKASRYYDYSLVKKISAQVKKEGYSAIIWEHPYYAWLAFRVRKKTGVKTVIHTHNIEHQRFRSLGKWWWPLLRMYEKWCFKNADLLFFIAPEERNFAIEKWGIAPEKCINAPFGVPVKENPADKPACREKIRLLHHIAPEEKIFLFNGLLDYKPNLDALNAILQHINPLLMKQAAFRYKIIICGKRLPPEMDELKAYQSQHIIYAGFVDDIEMYFKAADIFLNPVQSGGGIKTKMVEAIAFGTTVVAAESGAAGIEREVCGEKLQVVPDGNWDEFSSAIIRMAEKDIATPEAYYKTYFWGEIIKRIYPKLVENR